MLITHLCVWQEVLMVELVVVCGSMQCVHDGQLHNNILRVWQNRDKRPVMGWDVMGCHVM